MAVNAFARIRAQRHIKYGSYSVFLNLTVYHVEAQHKCKIDMTEIETYVCYIIGSYS